MQNPVEIKNYEKTGRTSVSEIFHIMEDFDKAEEGDYMLYSPRWYRDDRTRRIIWEPMIVTKIVSVNRGRKGFFSDIYPNLTVRYLDGTEEDFLVPIQNNGEFGPRIELTPGVMDKYTEYMPWAGWNEDDKFESPFMFCYFICTENSAVYLSRMIDTMNEEKEKREILIQKIREEKERAEQEAEKAERASEKAKREAIRKLKDLF